MPTDYSGWSHQDWPSGWGGSRVGPPPGTEMVDDPPTYSNPGRSRGSNPPGWRATDDEGGGYWEDGRRTGAQGLPTPFDVASFDPLRPQYGVPGLNGGYPTLAMLQYLTQTDLARRGDARQGMEFALNVGRQPVNWLDWWRLTRGQGRETAAGTPLPRFMGTGGQTVLRPTFPGITMEGERFDLPSGQGYNSLTPTEQAGLAGFYERLGVPLQDLFAMIQAPTQGLRAAGPAVSIRR